MLQCPGLSGLWKACPEVVQSLRPFEVQAFGMVGAVLIIAVFGTVLLTLALITLSLLRD